MIFALVQALSLLRRPFFLLVFGGWTSWSSGRTQRQWNDKKRSSDRSEFPWSSLNSILGVSENVVYPIVPNGFADHYPYEKWLFHWEY